MRKSRLLWIAAVAILHGLAQPPAWCGTTGKIAGQVTDKSTGEAYFGANIIVAGTTLGASTDANGNFTILQVPPGEYSVQVRALGYKSVTVTDVRIRIDQTASVNFNLESEAIQGEGVTVTVKREVVKQDVATSVASISGQEISVLPMNTVSEVAGLQAGIQEGRDGLIIRGGGADEALFQVDGITLRDPRNNKPITGIALSAIQEVSIERGGFNAEYGQVRSGLVNVVTQEGGKDGYSGSASFKFSPPQAKHFGISVFDQNSMWLRPYLDEDVCWAGTANGTWDKYTQQQYPTFIGWNAVSAKLLGDDDPANDLTSAAAQRLFQWQHRRRPVTDQPDYSGDAGFGGPVPFIGKQLGNMRFFTSYRTEREMLLIPLSREDYRDYDWSLRLTSDINANTKLKLSGLLGKSYNVAINASDISYYGTGFGISGVPFWNPSNYMRSPLEIARITNEQRSGRIFSDSWYCPAVVDYFSVAGQYTHAFSPKTFYDIRVEHLNRKYNSEPVYGRDKTKDFELLPGLFVDEAPFGFDSAPETGIGDGMFFGGHTSTVRDSSRVWTTSVRADLTSQVNFSNLVKTGIELDVSRLEFNYGTLNYFVGGRTWVNQLNKPVRGAFYIQDKLETKGFIVNAGLRLDYSNSNTDWIEASVFDKGYFSTDYSPSADYTMKKTKAQWSLSPRLSISHPITESSKLFFNYGHFKQLPAYEQLFLMGRGSTGQASTVGDPNLILSKTVSYELGYDHSLFDNFLIQAAAYYHDIQDQPTYVRYISADSRANYYQYTNQSYADIRGFELSLRKSTGRWWTAFANFTYEVTSSGVFGYTFMYQNLAQQAIWLRENRDLLQQNRPIPAPYARTHFSLHTPGDFGPKWTGVNPLADWALTLIGDWRAGGYYTWNEKNVIGVSQNVKIADFTNMSLRLNKTVGFKRFKATMFVEVENLFNTKYLSGAGFYDALDQNAYMQSLHLPKNNAYGNMTGDDKVGDYRKSGEFQPMMEIGDVAAYTNPDPLVIYRESTTGRYMQFAEGAWAETPNDRIQEILDNKSYIDMPNNSSFNFLNPRQIFFGIRTSFDLR